MSNARNLANLLGTNTTIQTAKLADDAITGAKLADDAITGAKLPAGTVLKTHFFRFNNSSSTGTTEAVIKTGTNITLQTNTAKILYDIHMSIGGHTYGGTVRLQYSTDNGSNWNDLTTLAMDETDAGSAEAKSHLGIHTNISTNGGEKASFQTGFTEEIDVSSATQFNWRLLARGSAGSYQMAVNRRGSSDGWAGLTSGSITEIAG